MNYHIYKLTFANGKIYIGKANKPYERFKSHKRAATNGQKFPVYHAWRKYGEPTLEILATFDDEKICYQAEIDFINSHDSINPAKGYNLQPGGEGNRSATSPIYYKIMQEKVWNNPVVRQKISEALKGRTPSESTQQAAVEYRATSRFKETLLKHWQNDERRKKAAERTRLQMANNGSAHLSKIFKGRGDVRSAEGKEAQRQKVTEFMNSAKGKAIARRGYEAFAANPDNITANRAALAKWRNSDANKQQCKEMAKKSAEKCSIKVMYVETGQIYNSQRDMAKAFGKSDATITHWVKAGKVVRI